MQVVLVRLLILAGLAVSAAGQTERYHWPLELPRVLTSSFAEYRSDRFHMGIDLRTGPIGQNVFAADAGYVSRVRCSPYGYGKAVYLTLQDGYTVVYGHLDDYMPELRDYVRAAQHNRQQYTVDLYPQPHEFPVRRGQFIAKSGQTGVGVPHLHYEIRDASGAPISPKVLGIDWPDTTRPVMRKLAVVPLDAEATINGDLLPVVSDLQSVGEGAYRAPSMRASGAIGFALDLVDPANNGASRLGVHTIIVQSGGETIFRLAHDRVSYSHQRDGAVAYHPYLEEYGRFLILWRWPGSEVDIYNVHPSDGAFKVPESAVDVLITALDFHGNAATLTVPIAYELPVETLAPPGENGRGVITYDTFGEHLVVTAQFDRPEPETPTLNDDAGRSITFTRIDGDTFRAAYEAPPRRNTAALTVIHPRVDPVPETFHVAGKDRGGVTVNFGAAQLEVPPSATFGTLFLQLRGGGGASAAALEPAGESIFVWPSNAPLNGTASLALSQESRDGQTPRPLIYQRSGSRWRARTTGSSGERLRVDTESFGAFAVMRDIALPIIRIHEPADGTTVATARPALRATIHDEGSGINTFRITANGQWLLAEYDPEEDLLEWERDEELAVGPNELVFEISDEAGNWTRRTIAIEVAP